MLKCPFCTKEMSHDELTCSRCGRVVVEGVPAEGLARAAVSRKVILLVVIGDAIFFGLVIAYFFFLRK